MQKFASVEPEHQVRTRSDAPNRIWREPDAWESKTAVRARAGDVTRSIPLGRGCIGVLSGHSRSRLHCSAPHPRRHPDW